MRGGGADFRVRGANTDIGACIPEAATGNTVLAVVSAITLGVFHGSGSKIAEEVWPHISAYVPGHF